MKFFWKYKLEHVLFWTVTILFHAFLSRTLIQRAGTFFFISEIIVRNSLLAVICYANILYLFPRFFKKKQYMQYAAGVILLLAFYVLIKNSHDAWIYENTIYKKNPQTFFTYTYYNFSVGCFYVFFSMTLMLSRQWYLQQQLLHQVQMEKLDTELQYLKSQINPHFLFNSINTVYFQIDKSNTAARETLEQFADLLRYQLYECNAELIPVEKEIKYLENYTALQRKRKNENCRICFKHDENVKGFSISPLLLIPFVENAFKFLSEHTHQPNEVCIQMKKEADQFIFSVFNTTDGTGKAFESGGIGLTNVKRRLELLYKDRYELKLNKTADNYSVHLKIKLP